MEPTTIVFCGHSLGAAISALTYMIMAKKFGKKYEFYNITFALPMFGNMALKSWFDENKEKLGNHMYHFVKADDIVPALLYANCAFNKLNSVIKYILRRSFSKFSIFHVVRSYLFGKLKEKEEEFEETAKKIKAFLTTRKQKCKGAYRQGPLCYFSKEVYAPIGQYILLEEQDLYELPNDPQFVGETLTTSLDILSGNWSLNYKHNATQI